MVNKKLHLTQLLESAFQHHRAGRLQQAKDVYRKVLSRDPDNPEANHLLGIMACQAGQLDTGVRLINRAIQAKPDYAGAYKSLGKALKELGRLDEAAACLRRALEYMPDYAEAFNDLGIVLKELKQSDAALTCLQKAVTLRPQNPESHFNLGNVQYDQGNFTEAAASFTNAINIRPTYVESYNNLGNALKHQGLDHEAITSFQKAIAINPGYAEAYNNLGNIYNEQGKLAEAVSYCRKAIALKPDFAEAYGNLSNALFQQGLLEEAIGNFRKAAKLGNISAGSTLLFALNYIASSNQEDIYSESVHWGQVQTAMPLPGNSWCCNSREKERRLRIGYVSPDFRVHSVAYFFEPVLKAHDRKHVEIFCYAEVRKSDIFTRRMQEEADHWFSITELDDAETAAQIRRDRIDILVDLAGHTRDSRLLVFAYRPAPVQVTWLGYPNTTGLQTIDYRLTDSIADPAGEADRLHSEKLIRLEHGFLCYQPDTSAQEVGPLPCLDTGQISFGSFNNLSKVTPEVIKVWAAILQAVPGSRLLLKAMQLGDRETRARYLKMFTAQGIAPDCIELHGRLPGKEEHLALYGSVDIGLDPFPYNGTTTTCEALWMGVPVVTLCGDRHAARVGASILHRVGVDELVAPSVADYVRTASALAHDRQRLQGMRSGLRRQMQESELMDSRLFTATLEDAYRCMWHTWCDSAAG